MVGGRRAICPSSAYWFPGRELGRRCCAARSGILPLLLLAVLALAAAQISDVRCRFAGLGVVHGGFSIDVKNRSLALSGPAAGKVTGILAHADEWETSTRGTYRCRWQESQGHAREARS